VKSSTKIHLSHYFIAFLFIIVCNSLLSNKLTKAYEALVEFNYFEAKRLFYKSVKKNPAPASFGLATIYYRKDNPFHSLDSAFKYIQIAKSNMASVKLKTKVKLEEFKYTDEAILELEQSISKGFYAICLNEKTIDCFNLFIKNHGHSYLISNAIKIRDSIDFSFVKSKNSSVSTSEFMNKYPQSYLKDEAQNLFYKQQFFEYTNKETLTSYILFLKECKENPYRTEAENKIYAMSTNSNTLKAIENFIEEFPQNKNVPDAWRRLYRIYMNDGYNSSKFETFLKRYPEYPFGNEIKNDEALSKLVLLPIEIEGKWGFMNENGKIIIPPTYDEAGYFFDDLAAVKSNEKYGYISKSNKWIIEPFFDDASDFSESRAIIEKNNKMGLIDRNGFVIFETSFEDIGPLSDGLMYAKKDSLYGYYTKNRINRIPDKFEIAESFENGLAHVRIEGKEAIIDSVGNFVVKPYFEEIDFYSDTLFVFSENEKFGICTKDGTPLHEAKYDFIGELENNRSIYVIDNKLGYFDEQAKIIIPASFETYPNFQTFSIFKNGLARVRRNGKMGLIDLNGKIFLPFNYQEIGSISNLISFKKNELWGYLDNSGKEKIKPSYEYAESFINNRSIVTKDSLMGLIDPNEKFVIQNVYSTITWLDDTNLLLVESGKLYGVYSDDGKILIPLSYQSITKINEDYLMLKIGNKVDYFKIKEQKLIEVNK
jgi:hypothetical protein